MSHYKDTDVRASANTSANSLTLTSENRGFRSGALNMGKRLSALGIAGLVVLAGPAQTAFAEGGGGGGVPGSGHGSSGAWDLYNLQYDGYTGSTPDQGYMGASTQWFIDHYNGPGKDDTSMGTGAKDQIKAACSIALDKAESRGGNKGTSRVVAIMWAGSTTSPWANSSSADKSFYQERWDNAVVGAGFPGIYTKAQPFMQKYWPEALAGGGATPSAVCIALNQDEPPQFTQTPPKKQLLKADGSALPDDGTLVAGQQYVAKIEAPANGHTGEMSIWDTIQTDKVWIGGQNADNASAVTVLDPDGKKVTGAKITINRAAGSVTVSGSVQVPDAYARGTYTLLVPTYVLPTGTAYDVKDGSHVTYNGGSRIDGNEEHTRKVTPTPDKSWVLDENGALTTMDPSWSNNTGADNKVFLPGESVAAVVNDYLPVKLAQPMTNYEIADDWSDSAKYIDFTDAAKANVYVETTPGSKTFKKVTDQFDISVDAAKGTTIAKAKPGSAFLKETAGQTAKRAVKLVLSGNFRTDYATKGETVKMLNKGWVVWNTEKKPTNEPPVYTWTPDPNKQVLGNADENGDHAHENINGMYAFPGQKLEYSIGVDLNIPGAIAHGVKSLAVEDQYDPFFTPDKTSIEFWDSRDPKNPRPLPRSAYKLTWDDAAHKWTAAFTDEWLAKNLGPDSQWLKSGWLTARFTGTVGKDVPPGSVVKNQAFEIINGSRTATEIPEVKIPSVKPDKEDLSTDLVDIDGKTLVKGDRIIYRLTLDASIKPGELAYKVHKLGMTDDYDEKFLSVDPAEIRVLDKASSEDVTAKFNIQVKNGIAYAYAKQVDSTGPLGNVIKGNPQPADLAAYAAAAIDPATTPIIDQALMGKFYSIMIPATVIKDQDGYVIKNQAVQNLENTHQSTRIVSNPLKAINPKKDVVVEAGKGDSINGQEVKLNSTFNYRLTSSQIPANRAYKASQWSITDKFDRVHDQYTGMWAVYADADLYNGEALVAKKGQLLQNSDGKGLGSDLFKAVWDEKSYTFTIEAQPAYLDLVNSREDLAQQWSAYTKMIRIAPAESVVNVHDETYNKVERKSNIVKTRTPEHPGIDLEKYTLREGLKAGDRDKADQALQLSKNDLQKGVKIGLRITNTGDVPLKNVKLTDATDAGKAGTVTDISCEVPGAGKVDPAKIGELVVGQSIDCTGLLQGMKAGDVHADTAKVVGESKFTGKKVSDTDPWNAKAPAPETPLAVTGGTGMAAFIGLGVALLGGAGALGMLGLRRKRQQPATADAAAE